MPILRLKIQRLMSLTFIFAFVITSLHVHASTNNSEIESEDLSGIISCDSTECSTRKSREDQPGNNDDSDIAQESPAQKEVPPEERDQGNIIEEQHEEVPFFDPDTSEIPPSQDDNGPIINGEIMYQDPSSSSQKNEKEDLSGVRDTREIGIGNDDGIRVFSDIENVDDEIRTAIQEIQKKEIIQGYADGTFRPDKEIIRAEFLKIVIKSAGEDIPKEGDYKNCFADVHEEWFAEYVCYAKERGWIKGYADGFFHPEWNVRLSEGIKILIEVNDIKIKDKDSSPWYLPYFELALNQGILKARDEDPERFITRGEMGLYVWRTDFLPSSVTTPSVNNSPRDEDLK
ncbi:S-layer homology domain-containing protein [Candidatus Peregrinibacteria bacterium]|nr:S-layer homology domain-containing protein [Candidatus Peregrinibacteria bacterium]